MDQTNTKLRRARRRGSCTGVDYATREGSGSIQRRHRGGSLKRGGARGRGAAWLLGLAAGYSVDTSYDAPPIAAHRPLGANPAPPAGAGGNLHVKLDRGKCTGCGLCLDACPQHALSMDDGALVIDVDRCKGCGTCVRYCPTGALWLGPSG